jgi:hypothetical protein
MEKQPLISNQEEKETVPSGSLKMKSNSSKQELNAEMKHTMKAPKTHPTVP